MPPLRPALTTLAAALTLALVPSVAQAGASLDACGEAPESAEARALTQAGHDLGAGDADRVRAAVAGVRKSAPGDAYLLLWAGSLLTSLHDPRACMQRGVVEQAKALAFAERFGKPADASAYASLRQRKSS